MSLIATLKDLQATLDYLRTVERDLSTFPPDLAALDQESKSLARLSAEAEKALQDWKAKREAARKEHAEALRLEELARKALRTANQKVQYAAAIRELDDRERQKAAAARPLKEAEVRCMEIEERLDSLRAKAVEVTGKFDDLHQIFLAEHETQVLAKADLTAKKAQLESALPPAELARFQRLVQTRQGRAVVPVENSTCMGCRVKLRMPFLSELRQKGGPMVCESCQRIVFIE